MLVADGCLLLGDMTVTSESTVVSDDGGILLCLAALAGASLSSIMLSRSRLSCVDDTSSRILRRRDGFHLEWR